MKFTEILEEFKKGEKVTREKWENSEAKPYKYITFERGKCIACSEDYTEEGEGTSYEGSIFEYDDFIAEDWKIYEEPNNSWQPEEGEMYFFVSSRGSVDYTTYNSTSRIDSETVSFGNCFKTREEAVHMSKKLRIITKLRKLSNVDFNSSDNNAYVISYDRELKKIQIDFHDAYNELPFNIHFATKEDCQKAIETIGEDNLKKYYFDVEE